MNHNYHTFQKCHVPNKCDRNDAASAVNTRVLVVNVLRAASWTIVLVVVTTLAR